MPPTPTTATTSPVLQTLALANNLWELHPPPSSADPVLAAEALRLHAASGAWLATQPSTATTTTTATTPRSSIHLLDLPAPTLLHVFSWLVPPTPGLNLRYYCMDGWEDFGALAIACRQLHALSQDDVVWRPVCTGLWPATDDEDLRTFWRTRGFAELYQRLARTSLCVEPGGYCFRWPGDFVLQCDVRDKSKHLPLFSSWGRLVCYSDALSARLECCDDESLSYVGDRTRGCAAWIRPPDYEDAPYPHLGMAAKTLFDDHPAMAGFGDTTEERYGHYWHVAALGGHLAVDVRVIHVPTGKASTLYTTKECHETLNPLTVEEGPPPDVEIGYGLGLLGLDKWVFRAQRMPSASPWPWVSLHLHTGWNDERVGIMEFILELDYGDESLDNILTMKDEIGMDRMIYRALQSLPWTD